MERQTQRELAKAYEPKDVEGRIAKEWDKSGLLRANPHSGKEPYCIVMPPPNVTGVLHMGHALVSTLQDLLIRWKRMEGREVLWVPGTDHAGISTQTVVERMLIATEGKRRCDYTREAFLEKVWAWKEQSESVILDQLKRLGCSCDWTRKRFTLDNDYCVSVRVMFKKLYDAGLICRGDYLVNWDPVTETALADDEVEYEDRISTIYTVRYPLEDGTGSIDVATTRPETILGDTAVAVSPEDPRYKALIGKHVRLPLTGRLVPIIADSYVDPAFGTGAVKMTPAHDFNDYEVGLRHNLPLINIMTKDGRINELGGEYAGLPMVEARKAIAEKLKADGQLIKVEAHPQRVGLSYRSKAVIEPFLSKQWFVKLTHFKSLLRRIVEHANVKLQPASWQATYYHWIDNLRDWCISRQLWWGHQIPVWHAKDGSERHICWEGEGVPPEVASNPDAWEQDHDVLDTWFSSALWPFATLGWPKETDDLATFYPNSILVTGHDILFFWVARMLTMGCFAFDQPPFPEVLLHGLIYGKSYWRTLPGGAIQYTSSEEMRAYDLGAAIPKDVQSKWEKMSKSKGNVIDPLEIIEAYGTDAMRFALASSPCQAREIDLDRRKFEESRNFVNKMWNGARFIFMNLEAADGRAALTSHAFAQGMQLDELDIADRWLLSRLADVITEVRQELARYNFDHATEKSYAFFWNELCAYYLELAKPYLSGRLGSDRDRTRKQQILAIVLLQVVRLLHPIAPYITEELFGSLKERLDGGEGRNTDPMTEEALHALEAPLCLTAPYPTPIMWAHSQPALDAFVALTAVVYALRNIRGEMRLNPGTACECLVIAPAESELAALLQKEHEIVRALVKISSFTFVSTMPQAMGSTSIVGDVTLFVPLPEEFRLQEKNRLEKEKSKLEESIARGQAQLSLPSFIEKAPPALVEKNKAQLTTWESDLAVIVEKLRTLTL